MPLATVMVTGSSVDHQLVAARGIAAKQSPLASVPRFAGQAAPPRIGDGIRFEDEHVITEWIAFYDAGRPRSALGGATPSELFAAKGFRIRSLAV